MSTQSTAVDWLNALGWALIHSLWQAAIIFLLTTVMLRLLPALRSEARYAVAAGALVLTMVISLVTFIQLLAKSNATLPPTAQMVHQAVYFPESALEQNTVSPIIFSWLEQNMSLVVSLWALGFLVFAGRWASGICYTYRIRSGARLLDGEWRDYVQRTATRLGIQRSVRVAESLAVSSPMVLGYLKPMILIPAGMIAGLPTQQLETILLHELAHVRRNDYLVNFFQTIIESVFFFNPFVRLLSSEIRREREHCCDDMVVRLHGNRPAYAHALLQLAECRLAAPALALAFAGEKNQLLVRIKRIMEGSLNNSCVKSRLIIPFLLLAVAISSILWIGADNENEKRLVVVSHPATGAPRYPYASHSSSMRIVTISQDGLRHERLIQQFHHSAEAGTLVARNTVIFHQSIVFSSTNTWTTSCSRTFSIKFLKPYRKNSQAT